MLYIAGFTFLKLIVAHVAAVQSRSQTRSRIDGFRLTCSSRRYKGRTKPFLFVPSLRDPTISNSKVKPAVYTGSPMDLSIFNRESIS